MREHRKISVSHHRSLGLAPERNLILLAYNHSRVVAPVVSVSDLKGLIRICKGIDSRSVNLERMCSAVCATVSNAEASVSALFEPSVPCEV